MKKYLVLLSLVGIIYGCTGSIHTKLYEECPSTNDVYKKHKFQLVSIRPDSEGWYTDECIYCGLQQKWGANYECTSQPGSVHIFKNPDTGEFDDYFVKYIDENGEEKMKNVWRSEIRKKETP